MSTDKSSLPTHSRSDCTNSFNWLLLTQLRLKRINPAGFNELKKELPKLNQLYNTYCPLIYITGICALYIKNNEFKACLNFISDLNQIITDKITC